MTTSEISVATIAPSKTNPRKSFDKDALQELTMSVRKHGVLQPVLVRPKTTKNGVAYELVAGHRRLRAAKAAKLDAIPAFVRELDDKQVLEIQVVENLQREDLHPLEEAEGYRRLVNEHGYAAEELADKVGKSKAYVYARMKLAEMPSKSKKLFYDGKLTPSTALLVARIPVKGIAEQAAQKISRGRYQGGEPMSFREARDYVQRECMLELKGAPFDTKDADLVTKAGTCKACPKRTGSQPDLFGDVRADVCTDPVCFRGKSDAAFRQRVEAGQAKGWRAANKTETKKLCSYGHLASYELHKAGLQNLDDTCWDDPRSRKWRTLLGTGCPPGILLQNPQSGTVHELVDAKAANKVLRERHTWAKGKKATSNRVTASEKKHRLQAKIDKEVIARAMAKVVEFAEQGLGKKADPTIWRLLAISVADAVWSEVSNEVAKRREIELKQHDALSSFEKWAAKASGPELAGFLVEVLASRSAHSYARSQSTWTGLCKLAGVNLGVLKRAVTKELTPAPKKAVKKKRKRAK